MIKRVGLYELNVDIKKFRSTNGIWNKEKFNSPWLWGFVSKLAGSDFDSKEEWIEFYYKSGEERLRIISTLSKDDQEMLLRFGFNAPDGLSKETQKYNLYYGRTRDELLSQAKIMYNKISSDITLEEWIKMVEYRILKETWNGIAREKNTICALEESVSDDLGLRFEKISPQEDFKYAVDFELFKDNELVYGIQIKPPSYMANKPYLEKAKKANYFKNQKYKNDKGVDVLYVYSETDGKILNEEVMSLIKSLFIKKPKIEELS